ncbi:MAG TPA: DUF1634 domain-containing protein [Tepidisphaeraceae bacterium]|jgi:uncharacterized membrane protein|nr:DUF1634 domain-containing protein [Tepidisphaeraceae bacterium]
MPPSAENSQPPDLDHKARQVEILISTLLRVGVIASLLVVIAGVVVTFIHHPDYVHSTKETARLTTPSRADFPRTIGEIARGLREGEGRSIVVTGLLLLIATPVLRVAVSIFAFVYERDWKFVVITIVVLAVLFCSFILGKATG